MSERDRELLKVAGVSVAKAATLVGKSRQAFYAGIKKRTSYLSISDLVILIQDTKRRDSSNLSRLLEFIEVRYSGDPLIDKELLIPSRVGIQQLLRACSNAGKIIVLINGNRTHLGSQSPLMRTLVEILNNENVGRTEIVVPNSEIKKELDKLFEIPTSQLTINLEMIDIPTILISKNDSVRAFGFTNTSVEELDGQDAEWLWELALSRVSKV